MFDIIKIGFKTSLILFVFLGILLVLGQLVGLIIVNGQFMIAVYDVLSPLTFILSAIAAILGFLLNYIKKEDNEEVEY
ncbi:hypothetical protein QGM71_07490 [Virgibacillus sp. C22-A2]|uniref:Uncharacterized protein n=1 Tax=Virgibacillus tibetensis TaxID=3042313 RepID=A0ABU6KDT2_9BACI|nr:hypothetical protein [Virgibacillus sp. C22-A2]